MDMLMAAEAFMVEFIIVWLRWFSSGPKGRMFGIGPRLGIVGKPKFFRSMLLGQI